MGKLYNKDSIESLSPLEFTRLRPNVYCGDTADSTQLLVEIISNSIDEYRAGHGEKIEVKINKDDTVEVRDYGQGFLVNEKRPEDGKTILEAAFSVLNTSGKYSDDGVYGGNSLGTQGIGSKITTYLSHWLTVTTIRDKKYETINFKEGEFESRKVGKSSDPTGTIVTWLPSEKFFTDRKVDIKKVKDLLYTISCLCPGLEIVLTIGDKTETYLSKNGLEDYVIDKISNKEIIGNRFHCNLNIDEKNKLDFIITYTKDYNSNMIAYVNTGLTEKGPHITLIKTLITREFNKFFRDKGWIKEKEDNLDGSDIQEGMYVVFNITAPNVAYDAQVKSTITKIDMKPFTGPLGDELHQWLEINEKEIKIIADKALNARKAREAAKKARDAVRKEPKKEKGLKAKMAISTKFIDCADKNPSHRNLLLVEGLSAGSSAIEARNAKTDCIYMLRGKVISPLKTEVSKILANQEMSDIINIIGGGFGKDFDISKVKVDKVVITSDQDSDGDDIALLLMTFFFTYMRPLVDAGMLYRAVTPLYILRKGKEEKYFYSEKEMEDWKKNGTKGWEILRAKGLGELNANDLHKVCFQNQRFKRITISDAKKSAELLEILEGESVGPRKQYIYDNATELGFNFD